MRAIDYILLFCFVLCPILYVLLQILWAVKENAAATRRANLIQHEKIGQIRRAYIEISNLNYSMRNELSPDYYKQCIRQLAALNKTFKRIAN